MKILHINTYDIGGAATACLRIHKSLLAQGVDSKVLVLYKTKDIEGLYHFDYWLNTRSFLHYIVKKIKLLRYNRAQKNLKKKLPPSDVQFSFPRTIFDIIEHPLYKEADIIQLNWTAGFLDEPSFFAKNNKPIIWRMADLYTCGGGNHYELNFPAEAYKKYTIQNTRLRQESLRNKNLFLVPISEWVKQKASESSIVGRFPSRVIHNGINLDVFKTYNIETCRKIWNLPLDKKVVLVGADHNNDLRKGGNLLLDALKKIENKNIHICTFGSGNLELDGIQNLGKIGNERFLSTLYAAADLFIMSSLEEAFGQVTIESLASGTPVVSFPNGGSRDIIIDGLNGFLTEDFSSNSLIKQIKKALDYSFDRNAIREDIKDRFNIEDKANDYIALYKQLLNN